MGEALVVNRFLYTWIWTMSYTSPLQGKRAYGVGPTLGLTMDYREGGISG